MKRSSEISNRIRMSARRKASVAFEMKSRNSNPSQELIYQAIAESARDGIVVIDSEGVITYVNPAHESIFGYSKEESVGQQVHQLMSPPRYADMQIRGMAGFKRTGEGCAIGVTNELVGKHKDGHEFPMELSLVSVESENGGRQAIGIIHDISNRKKTENALRYSQENLEGLVEKSQSGIVMTDTDGNITVWNPSQELITGLSHEEVIGRPLWEVQMSLLGDIAIQPGYKEKLVEMFQGFLQTGIIPDQYKEHDDTFTNKQGNKRTIHSSIFVIEDKGTFHLASISTDVTEQKRLEADIIHMSTHDDLTGLYNRYYYELELARLDVSRQYPIAVIYIDIDKFKIINDTLGHSAGDDALKQAAKILLQACREDDIVCRSGGDEFVILLPQTNRAGVKKIIDRINEILVETKSKIKFSIGVAFKTKDGQNLRDVVDQADIKMYDQKQLHKQGDDPDYQI